MARVTYTDRLARDVEGISSHRVLAHLRHAIERLETFPLSSSPLTEPSFQRTFGAEVRKVAVAPFDLVCMYDQDADTVCLLALVYSRSVR